MIDQYTIERIIDTAQIVDVIQDFVTLKKRGVNYLGLCPFHNEKTPSFTVSPSKGIYKCFGCGKGGNSVNFIMEHEHMSYPEALKYLARKYNIEITEKELTREEIAQRNERDSLLVVTQYAQKYFTETLHEHNEGKAIGLSYFRERGFREDIIEKFQLGYCPDQKDAFTQNAVRKGYKLDLLVKTGLSIQKNVITFDRFSGRVMFPIHGLSGNVIAFGGRTLKKDKTVAKYLNSPESDIYHKSKVLYGIYHAKKTIVQEDRCYLVEGYTDVISLHQAGIENVVASSGTALTPEQIRLIKRFTRNITILYDGDEAGIKASIRGIDLILEEGMNVKVLLFPDGEDPDSYAAKVSSSELLRFIADNENDFITFKTKLLLSDAGNDPVKRAGLIQDIVRSISVIPDGIIRSVYLRECSNLLKVGEEVLYAEISKRRKQKAEQEYRREQGKDTKTGSSALSDMPAVTAQKLEITERELIRLLLNYGNKILFSVEEEDQPGTRDISVADYIITEITGDELELVVPANRQIFEDYQDRISRKEHPETRFFINHIDDEVRRIAADMLTPKYTLSKIHRKGGALVETEEMKLSEIVPKQIFEYKETLITKRMRETELKMKAAQEESRRDEFEELLQEYIILTQLKIMLAKNLGGRAIIR
ncbi:MAG: DNA primase [Bacteroidetes bacterium]|nr:DNA primase [Bacteroidota bacterium]